MNLENVKNQITEWLLNKLEESGCNGFVVGVSGGIDSAVTSTLCAATGAPTLLLNMPINQESGQYNRSNEHIENLSVLPNVHSRVVDLTNTYKAFVSALGELTDLSRANLQSRIRMCVLYAEANNHNHLVAGTGNKVEDYGIGFFTKYGDGGVDVSPIADLLKSEVYALGRHLGVAESILVAKPTDGLWDDDRGDEDQIGATYDELEWALDFYDNGDPEDTITPRQGEVLEIYTHRHKTTKHKLEAPPVCYINREGE